MSDRLVANRVALQRRKASMEGSVPTRLLTQAPADLAGSVPLGQISNHSAAKDLITKSTGASSGDARPRRLPCRLLGHDTARQDPLWRAISGTTGDRDKVGDTHLDKPRPHI